MASALSTAEKLRYNRHLILNNVGIEGQTKLKAAKVLVIGAGGLGCPILQYLTAAGVGTIGIVDFDVVDESNLQRQILFNSADIGQPKAQAARAHLAAQNPHVQFEVFETKLTAANALAIFESFDIVVDGSDNFPTRYLVNDACVILNKPLVFGSIFKFEGQVSVFNYQGGPTYRCLFPAPPAPGEVPNCAQIGVIGVLAGLIGTMQANETIKLILGIGEPLAGKIALIDALTMNTTTLKIRRNDEAANVTELIDYEDFCGLNEVKDQVMETITAEELAKALKAENPPFVLDVREPHEYEICHLKEARHIPMNEVPDHLATIPREGKVVVHCLAGGRSATVIEKLQTTYGYTNLVNLEGGIRAWAQSVDPTMPTY